MLAVRVAFRVPLRLTLWRRVLHYVGNRRVMAPLQWGATASPATFSLRTVADHFLVDSHPSEEVHGFTETVRRVRGTARPIRGDPRASDYAF